MGRRTRLTLEQVGPPISGPVRLPWLRCEEIARSASTSTEHHTQVEQGRMQADSG
ncbi:hypothetical protein [Streptomyces sp. CA-179760]|uniref:hypothetical protein n=1 Tax=Streptomyces sp. CA-179760 TaxID=3240054 RepID=UPI003D943EA5